MVQFNSGTFFVNLGIACGIIILSLVLHRIFIIGLSTLDFFSFSTKRKAPVKSMLKFIHLLANAMIHICLSRQGKIPFIQKYGFVIFTFLNFEAKFLLAITLQSLIMVFLSLLFLVGNNLGITVGDFLIGKMDFEDLAFFFTLILLVFSVLTYAVIFILRAETRQAHLHFILRRKVAESKYSLLPHVILLRQIPLDMNRNSLRAALADVIGCNPHDMDLVLFPKMSKLVNLKIKLDELNDQSLYRLQRSYWFYKLFKSRSKYEQQINESIERTQEELKLAVSKQQSFNGTAILCLFKLEHLQSLYAVHREFEGQSDRHSQMRTELREKLLSKSMNSIIGVRKSFMTDSSDILLKNIDLHAPSYLGVRVILYVGLALIIVFISTPATIIQGFGSLIANDIIGAKPDSFFSTPFGKFVILTLNPIITFLLNSLMIYFINVVGRWQKLAKHSEFQVFALRMSFAYLIVNMFILPGFSLNTAKSIFELFLAGQFSLVQILKNFHFYETGTFYSILLLQSSAFNFLISLLLLPVWAQFGFSFEMALTYLKDIRKNQYRKLETDVFEFGYFYSYDCVILYVVIVFGIYQPLIIFTAIFYFFFKLAGNSTTLVMFFKDQLYDKNMLLDRTLNRLKFAVVMSYFVLAFKCYLTKKTFLLVLNLFFLAGSITLAILLRRKTFTLDRLFDFLKRMKTER